MEYIERVFPFRGKVGKARVLERQGNFDSAVAALLDIHQEWEQGHITLSDAPLVDLCLNISWAIVSGRLEVRRAVGQACRTQAQQCLGQYFDTLRISEQIIRLYNILANYEEWQGNPDGAIENYDRALQIPGASQSGVSNLLVNKGIALRQLGRLEPAALYGEQGVGVKTAIGDADQLPIAQHNLAQTYLELAQASDDAQQRQNCWQQAERHAQDGLTIQARTGSIKKRGQLFTERFLARWNLGTAVPADWQAVRDWLHAQQAAGHASTYDFKVVIGELLGGQAPWKGQDADALLAWQFEGVGASS